MLTVFKVCLPLFPLGFTRMEEKKIHMHDCEYILPMCRKATQIDGTSQNWMEWAENHIKFHSENSVLFWDQITLWFIITCLLCISKSDPRGPLSLNHRAQHNVAIMLLTFFVGELRLKGRVQETSPWRNPGWAARERGRVLNEHKPDSLRVNSLACAAARRLVALYLPAHLEDEWLLVGHCFSLEAPVKGLN